MPINTISGQTELKPGRYVEILFSTILGHMIPGIARIPTSDALAILGGKVMRLLIGLLILLVTGCATGPKFPLSADTADLTPHQVAADETRYVGQTIVWGGLIIEATNLAEKTRLIVLAYPLDRHQAPKLFTEPIGRFIAYRSGYLETADFAPQRRITVLGKIQGIEEGNVGEARYQYPVIQAQQLYLWPKSQRVNAEPSIHIGIGFSISN